MNPNPAPIASPLSSGPIVLPRLKAAMLLPEAIVGASWAYLMIRSCSAGTDANPVTPMSTSMMIVRTDRVIAAVSATPPIATLSA